MANKKRNEDPAQHSDKARADISAALDADDLLETDLKVATDLTGSDDQGEQGRHDDTGDRDGIELEQVEAASSRGQQEYQSRRHQRGGASTHQQSAKLNPGPGSRQGRVEAEGRDRREGLCDRLTEEEQAEIRTAHDQAQSKHGYDLRHQNHSIRGEIGRASSRERVWQSVSIAVEVVE